MTEPRLITGDCRTVLSGLNQRSVHCVITSPPYWGLRDYGVDDQIGLEETVDEYVRNLVEVFDKVRRVLRDDGTLWLNLGDAYAGSWSAQSRCQPDNYDHSIISGNQIKAAPITTLTGSTKHTPGLKPKDLIGLPWRVAFALQADGWYLRSDIIWHKPNPMPSSVKDRPTTAHEYVFLLSKSERYYYDHEAIAEDVAESQVGRVRSDSVGGKHWSERNQHSPGGTYETRTNGNNRRGSYDTSKAFSLSGRMDGESTDTEHPILERKRNARSVWTINTQPCPEAHFATFPEKLVEPCILAGCPEEGTVLDPFSGSGTTGKVAIQYGRNYIGIELNPEYTAIAEKRFDQKRLFA